MKESIKSLDTKLWKTKGARYNASQRMETRYSYSRFTLSMLSTYVIIINIIGIYYRNTDYSSHLVFIPPLTAALGVMILVLSQHEVSRGLKLKSIEMFRCAKKIDRLYNEFKLHELEIDIDKKKEIFKLTQKQYADILDEFQNHKEIDYLKFMASRREDFNLSLWKSMIIKLKFYAIPRYQYLLLLIGLPVLVLIYFYYYL